MSEIRIAITGAAGDVGFALAQSLAAIPGVVPVGLVRNELQGALFAGSNVEVRVGDVTKAEDAKRLLASCRIVVHCALATGPPREALRTNETMLRRLAEHGAWKTSVHFSTVAVYGRCLDTASSSFERPAPRHSYGRTKLHLEHVARRTLGSASRRTYLLRVGHVYGPGQNVTRQVATDLDDPRFALPFGGRRASNAVSIARVARAVIGLVSAGSEYFAGTRVYNLADAPMLDWRTLYDRHTDAWALAPVPELGSAQSSAARAAAIAPHSGLGAAFGELVRPMLSAFSPVRIARQQALRGLVDAMRARAPARAEELARRAYLARSMADQVRAVTDHVPSIAPRLLSDAMPGPFLDPDGAFVDGPAEEELEAGLAAWYRQTHEFRWDSAELGID